MLDSKLFGLLDVLSETEYMTSKKLSEIMGISDRTVQTRIKDLRDELDGHGATVRSKQRYGYLLSIHDRTAYTAWLSSQARQMRTVLPNSVEERFQYLLALLLTTSTFRKLEDLSTQLCVSTKTLSSELKSVEDTLSRFQLVLERRPYYGIRIHGNEFDIRKCCIEYLFRPEFTAAKDRILQTNTAAVIRRVLLSVMAQYKVRFSEQAFQSINRYLYTTWRRNQDGHVITIAPGGLELMREMREYVIAINLIKELAAADIAIRDEPGEIQYISAYLAGLRILSDEHNLPFHPQSQETVHHLTSILLDCVYRVYGLNFRDNLDVRIALYHHMLTFYIRMLYGIPLENPILEEIKQNYPFAFSMAQLGMAKITEHYNRKISEDETGYVAMILEMALEASKSKIERKNILLVCMTGKSSSRFLEFRFRNEFGAYIDQLRICSLYEFSSCDLRGIDYIFTTVPLDTDTTVPVYVIDNFLDSADTSEVRRKLELGSVDFLKDYYREELFFPNVPGNTWKEITKNLCILMAQAYPLPDGFWESVVARELKGSTDFGNSVAIPHPEDCLVQENVVSVGILEKPILWSRNMVQMVILSAIYDSTSSETQRFYQLTSALLSDSARISRAIAKRSYPDFMKLFLE